MQFGVTSTGQGLIRHNENQPLIIGTNSVEHMRIMQNGNVVIGATVANAKLDVVSTTE